MPTEILITGESKGSVTRRQLWRVMHDGHGLSGHAFNVALVILIILSVAVLPLELMPYFRPYHHSFLLIEAVLTALFTVEYCLRIYAAPKRMRYIFSFYGIIDFLAIVPFYLGFFASPSLRALRILRLFKIGEIEAAGTEEEEHTLEHDVGLAPDEKVEYIVSRHPLYLFLGCLPPLLAFSASLGAFFLFGSSIAAVSVAVALLLFGLIFFWRTWLDYSYDLIYITSRRLIFQNQHLLGRSINQVNYYAITNVKPYYSSAIGYIFGYGSIEIETPSATVGKVELHMVRGHEKAAHLIMAKCTSNQDLSSISPLAAETETS
ncbi:MAG: ion transporter [Candidatus Peregrinibacteria bacterium Gr01-1014_25]|nr:MAG: ion transporter [Candidatus Peregrinibacteria bacterium Gr01-1014_25]